MRHVFDITEPIKPNSEFVDQGLAKAYSICLRIMCEYHCRASEGKLSSTKRSRNNWNADAASQCADAIADLDHNPSKDVGEANPKFNDQGMANAYSLCLRIVADHEAHALGGKPGGVRRNRGHWKSRAAKECACAIADVDALAIN